MTSERILESARPRVVRIIFCVVTAAVPALAQRSTRPVPRGLQSSKWTERAAAFDSIAAKGDGFSTPTLRSALLQLLEREDELIASTIRASKGRWGVSDKFGEEFGEYHANLVNACLKYCDKSGLLRLMVHNATHGAEARSGALELLGTVFDQEFSGEQRDQIVDALARVTRDSLALNRYFSLRGIGRVIPSANLSAVSRERIHGVLITAAVDREAVVRLEAVHALGELRDARDRALLSTIAVSDTSKAMSHGKVTYPVRDAATSALSRLPP